MAYDAPAESDDAEAGDRTTDDVGGQEADVGLHPFGADADAADPALSVEALSCVEDTPAAFLATRRGFDPGSTFFCAVDSEEENHYTHDRSGLVCVETTRWDRREYRQAFRSTRFTSSNGEGPRSPTARQTSRPRKRSRRTPSRPTGR